MWMLMNVYELELILGIRKKGKKQSIEKRMNEMKWEKGRILYNLILGFEKTIGFDWSNWMEWKGKGLVWKVV